jgi:hypothetical protein
MKNESCFSYDAVNFYDANITGIDWSLQVKLECNEEDATITAKDVRYFITRTTNNICTIEECTNLNIHECNNLNCSCIQLEKLETCQEIFPDLVDEINNECENKKGKCTFNLPRRIMTRCERTARDRSPYDSKFTFSYGQYVKVDFYCLSKYVFVLFQLKK